MRKCVCRHNLVLKCPMLSAPRLAPCQVSSWALCSHDSLTIRRIMNTFKTGLKRSVRTDGKVHAHTQLSHRQGSHSWVMEQHSGLQSSRVSPLSLPLSQGHGCYDLYYKRSLCHEFHINKVISSVLSIPYDFQGFLKMFISSVLPRPDEIWLHCPVLLLKQTETSAMPSAVLCCTRGDGFMFCPSPSPNTILPTGQLPTLRALLGSSSPKAPLLQEASLENSEESRWPALPLPAWH